MSFYVNNLDKISGDILIIVLADKAENTRGLYEIADWKLNSLLSKTIKLKTKDEDKKFPILIPSSDKLAVSKLALLKQGRNLRLDIVKILKGLDYKICTISFPHDYKKDLKNYITEELKKAKLDYHNIEEEITPDEKLIRIYKKN